MFKTMRNKLKHILLKTFNSKYREINYQVFNIVAEGLTASEYLADGKMLPTIMIDTQENKAVPDLIKYHEKTPPGDTSLTWGRDIDNSGYLILNLCFTKPMNIEFGIQFIIEDHYALIDGIIQSRGLILLTGKKGEKVSNLDISRITIEVPFMNFDNKWNEILRSVLETKLQKFQMSKKEAEEITKQQIQTLREVWKFRKKIDLP